MAGMIPMMKNFIADWRKYHKTLGKQDAWIRKYAEQNGYSVNPRWMVYTNLKLWLSDSEEMYGRRYCPCFEPTGDKEADRKLICPCTYLAEEVAQRGWCHCTLFGRATCRPLTTNGPRTGSWTSTATCRLSGSTACSTRVASTSTRSAGYPCLMRSTR